MGETPKNNNELFLLHLIDTVSQYIYEDETVLSTPVRESLIEVARNTFEPTY
jgi:hypothetical protein